MQRWEYLVVRIDLAGGDRPLVRWVNDKEIENWKQSAPVWDRLDEYGELGWELVGFELFGTRHTSMVLKRPKE